MRLRSKALNQRRHAKLRAKERYNIELSRFDLKEIIELIQTNKSECVMKQSKRIAIHKVTYKDMEMYAVYDSLRKEIATFLTEDMVTDNIHFEIAGEGEEDECD